MIYERSPDHVEVRMYSASAFFFRIFAYLFLIAGCVGFWYGMFLAALAYHSWLTGRAF